MINWLLCHIIGHNWKLFEAHEGMLSYPVRRTVVSTNRCQRCGKFITRHDVVKH